MQDKKENVINRFFMAFQKKRPPCDDIVTAADKVIEDYIFCKNKLLISRCKIRQKRESLFLSLVFISVFAAIGILYFMLSS